VPAIVAREPQRKNGGGVKPSDVRPLIRGGSFTGTDLQSGIIQAVIFCLIMLVIRVITNSMTFLPALRRVQAFEDVLTMAKASRKGVRDMTKPP
jgi:hypothetical protein